MRKLDNQQQKKETELISVCKEHQGEYLDAHHGSGSWATTYSNEFIDAATKLWDLYLQIGNQWPCSQMSKAFIDAGVFSCRGSKMTVDKVEYLYMKHMRDRVKS